MAGSNELPSDSQPMTIEPPFRPPLEGGPGTPGPTATVCDVVAVVGSFCDVPPHPAIYSAPSPTPAPRSRSRLETRAGSLIRLLSLVCSDRPQALVS
jgi:hypothetical protein